MFRRFIMAGLACAIAISLGGITLAHAQDRTARQYGYQAGYKDGFHHGRRDSRAAAKYDYKSDDFKNATHGYDKFMGEHDDYKKGYRKGYVAGYDDAYYGRPGRFDTYGPVNDDSNVDESGREANDVADVAYRTGYRDGLIDGGKDRRDGRDFQPSEHDKYEDADNGFQPGYGKRKIYKAEYRQGYRAGYQYAYGPTATVPAP